MQLTGIHHLTAISAKPRENLAFYTGLLGMRLVKKTVNQDDVSAYHLFYADGKANPGTDLTFFDFPAAPERRGANSISTTSLRVAGEKSIGFWRDRLKKARAHAGEVAEVDGRLTLPFEDGEGQRLVLIDDGGAGPSSPWEKSPVPVEYQIRGLGPIVLSVHELGRTALVLTSVMNMRHGSDQLGGARPGTSAAERNRRRFPRPGTTPSRHRPAPGRGPASRTGRWRRPTAPGVPRWVRRGAPPHRECPAPGPDPGCTPNAPRAAGRRAARSSRSSCATARSAEPARAARPGQPARDAAQR